jgi:integrase
MTPRQRGSSVKRVTLKNGEVRWRFRLDLPPGKDGKRRQRTITKRTEREAIEAQAKARGQVTEGTYVERSGDTVADVIDSYLAVKSLVWRPGTLSQNTSALRPLRDKLGAVKVQSLTDEMVAHALAGMLRKGGRSKQGRSVRTVSIARQLLVAALERAVKGKRIARNPATDAQLQSYAYHRPEPWSEVELRAFLDAVDDSPLVGAWALSASGLRRGEVLGLRWSDVDWAARTIRVHRARILVGGQVAEGPLKTESTPERTVPIDDELERALRLTRQRTGGNVTGIKRDGYVAVDALGQPLHPGWYGREFARVVRAHGLRPVRLHDVRHAVASIMVRSGLPPAEVASILGHSVEVLLSTYTHSDETAKRTAMTAFRARLRAV